MGGTVAELEDGQLAGGSIVLQIVTEKRRKGWTTDQVVQEQDFFFL